jgi:4-amino-4-deoxy-L-arabinose transferase-like glycosyltransferase
MQLIHHLSASKRRFLFIIILLFCALRIVMMIQTPLTDTTESRYAEIARKMVETNNWITPQYDYGVPFWAKPPLSTWLSAFGMKIFGVNQFGSRFFIFVVAVGIGVMTYQWLKNMRGKDYALIVTTILASTTIFFISAGMVMTDLVMIFGTTLSMMAFWTCMHDDQRRRLHGYLFFVGLSIGLLAKGPVAVVLTAIPIGLWVILNKEWKTAFTKIPWFIGIGIILIIAGPWYYLAERATPGFINYFIVGEHFNRFVVSGWEGDLYGSAHSRTMGTIWVYWFLTTLPWSPLIIVCGVKVYLWRSKLELWRKGWLSYLILWTLAPLMFFTPARNIIPSYSLSAVVGCAVLTLELWILAFGRVSDVTLRKVYLSSIVFSFIVFIGAYVFFTFMPKTAPKFSASKVLERIYEHEENTNNVLNIYGEKRSYSAEFYTEGKVVRIPDEVAIKKLLENGSRDYLSVSPRDYNSFSDEIRSHFDVVDTWRRQVLLCEKNSKKTPLISNQKES